MQVQNSIKTESLANKFVLSQADKEKLLAEKILRAERQIKSLEEFVKILKRR